MFLNQVFVAGNVGKDPQVFGDKVCRFSIATTEYWKQNGEKQSKTTWVNVVAFKNLIPLVSQYVSKGSNILVVGRLQNNKWTDKNGVERNDLEMVASSIQFCEKGQRGDTRADNRSDEAPQENGETDSDGKPLPF